MKQLLVITAVCMLLGCIHETEKTGGPPTFRDSAFFPSEGGMTWKYSRTSSSPMVSGIVSTLDVSLPVAIDAATFQRRVDIGTDGTPTEYLDTCQRTIPFNCTLDPLPNPERTRSQFSGDTLRYLEYAGVNFLYDHNAVWSTQNSDVSIRLFEENVGLIYEERISVGPLLGVESKTYLMEFGGQARDTGLVAILLKL